MNLNLSFYPLSTKLPRPVWTWVILLVAIQLFFRPLAVAQITSADCNAFSPLITTKFNSLTVTSSQVPIFGGDHFSPKANLIDGNITNSASWTYLIAGSAWIDVKDNNATGVNVYPAGSFAGFAINDNALITALGTTRIRTYLGTVEQESVSSASLISTGIVSGIAKAGFYTTKSFDRIRFEYSAIGAGTMTVYYAIVQRFCAGPVLDCNVQTAMTNPVFPTRVNPARTGGAGVSISYVDDQDKAVSGIATDHATLVNLVGLVGSASLSVQDVLTNYPAGTFAGFDIENVSLLGLSLFNNITINTFKDGVSTGESKTGTGLAVSGSILGSSGRQTVGFVTSQEFDEVQIVVNQPLGITLGSTNVYSAVFQKFCAGPQLACNTPTALTSPAYPVIISGENTGISGVACAACQVSNTSNLIDNNPTNHADIVLTAGVAVSGSIGVKSVGQTYPAGTFAGFDINSPSIIGVSLLSGMKIETYLNGIATGESAGNGNLLSGSSALLSGSGRQTIGFLTTLPFDEVKLTLNQTASVSLGTTEVYGAVLTRFCKVAEPECNTLTRVTNPDYPVYVNGKNTGITSAACAACTINDSQNVVDADLTNAATIVLAAGVASTADFSVANAVETYPANTFAGFDVETATLLSAGALSTATIYLYNNGALVQTGTGNALIIGATSSLLTGGVSRQIVGIVADVPYDEVKISFSQVIGANLGNIKIYSAIFDKLCEGAIACNNSYILTQPTFPVVINSVRTGISGAACAACIVQDPWNVISSSNTDFARISVVAGILSTGSLSVVNPISEYPAGTAAGFVIRDANNLAQLDLFNSITISTYKDGVLRESKTAASLIDLALLINWIGPGSTPRNVGFITSQSFDEVRIEVAALGSLVNIVDVFGAYVDTRSSVGGNLLCLNTNPDVNVANINVSTTGNLSTNDNSPVGTTYGAAIAVAGNPSSAAPAINANGTYTFIAATPGIYKFQIPVCLPLQTTGCGTETLTITIIDPDASTNYPVVNTDLASARGSDTAPIKISVNVKANDGTGNVAGILGLPTITVIPAHGVAVVTSAGMIEYTPNPGFYGVDVLTYSVCEAPSGLCGTADVVIAILPSTAPNLLTATDDYHSAPKNVLLSVTAANGVLANDSNTNGNPMTVTGQNTTIPNVGTLNLAANGGYTFTPVTNYVGSGSWVYEVCEGSNCKKATLYILVRANDPLPVTLKSFAVAKEGTVVNLFWETTEETNSDYFEIQRSANARDWKALGTVKSSGESKSSLNYTYADQTATDGLNYYRLRMVDKDNTFAYSRIESIRVDGISLSVYPNPVSDILFLKGVDTQALKEIVLVNTSGVTVFQSSSVSSGGINVKNLSNGIYLVKITQTDGTRSTHKVIISR